MNVVAWLLIAAQPVFGTWRNGDLPLSSVAAVAAHPTVAGIVFASTSSGIYRSTDFAQHWERVSSSSISTFVSTPMHPFAFNPFDPSQLCALGDLLFLCSADFGTTWATFPQAGINFVLFDSRVDGRLWMGPVYGDAWLLISDDGGATWSARGLVPGHPWYHSNASVDSGSGTIFEDASPHGVCIPSCGIFRSLDNGGTWSEILPEESSWLATSNRSLIAVLSDGRVVGSDDLGANWLARGSLPVLNAVVTTLAADPRDPLRVYAGESNGRLFASGDGGRTWKGIDESAFGGARIQSVAVGSDGILYVATADHVFANVIHRRRASRP